MISAPRDGTVIIALHTDRSGVRLIRWGTDSESGRERWFESDWGSTFEDWAGWLPAPELEGGYEPTIDEKEISEKTDEPPPR
jgi:hypothetical protein